MSDSEDFKQRLLDGSVECGLPPCHRKGTQACAKCRSIGYCGKGCQTAHWPAHKKSCRAGLRRQRTTDSIEAYGDLRRAHQDARLFCDRTDWKDTDEILKEAVRQLRDMDISMERAKALDVSTARGSRVQQARQDNNAEVERVWCTLSDGERELLLRASSSRPGPEHEATVLLHRVFYEKHGPSVHPDPASLELMALLLELL